jgi:anti-sigma factor RsiW
MKHLDEGTIHAWLDGVMTDAEEAEVERHVEQCAACRARVARARGLIAGASRILSALDDVPAGVVPVRERAGSVTQRTVKRRWVRPAALAVAAGLMLVVGVETAGRYDGRAEPRRTAAAKTTGAPPQMGQQRVSAAVRAETAVVQPETTAAKLHVVTTEPAAKSKTTQPLVAERTVDATGSAAAAPPTVKAVGGARATVKMLPGLLTDAPAREVPRAMSGTQVGVAPTASASPAFQRALRDMTAAPPDTSAPGRIPVCYTSGVATLLLDPAAAPEGPPGWRVLRSDGRVVGRWTMGPADSLTLWIEHPQAKELRGVVHPAGVALIEGSAGDVVWMKRTECTTGGR